MCAHKQLKLPSASLLLKITSRLFRIALASWVLGSQGYRAWSLAGVLELITSPNYFESNKIVVGFFTEMISYHKILIGANRVKLKLWFHVKSLPGEPVKHFVLAKIGFCAVLGQTELNACLLEWNLFSDCKNQWLFFSFNLLFIQTANEIHFLANRNQISTGANSLEAGRRAWFHWKPCAKGKADFSLFACRKHSDPHSRVWQGEGAEGDFLLPEGCFGCAMKGEAGFEEKENTFY